MIKFITDKIHSDFRLTAIFYGAIGSLLATAIWTYSPSLLSWLGEYTFGLLKNFIDSRYVKAATLEPSNYSYFILLILFVIIVIGWLEISSRIKNDLVNNPKEKKDNNKKSEPIPKWVPKAFLGVRVLIGFYLFYGLLFIAGESTVLNSITDFKQHIRIIEPYITPEKKSKLVSQWSQMRSLKDYNAVYEELLKIAKEKNIKLYRNKQY